MLTHLWAVDKIFGLCVLVAHTQPGSSKSHVWVAQAVLRSPTQLQHCTNTAVLPPRQVPGSQCHASEGCVPRDSHQHQCPVPVGVTSFSCFLLRYLCLATALLFLWRNWQLDTMRDLTWRCVCYCGMSPKLIHVPRAVGNAVQRNLRRLCGLLVWRQHSAGVNNLSFWSGSAPYAAGCV